MQILVVPMCAPSYQPASFVFTEFYTYTDLNSSIHSNVRSGLACLQMLQVSGHLRGLCPAQAYLFLIGLLFSSYTYAPCLSAALLHRVSTQT